MSSLTVLLSACLFSELDTQADGITLAQCGIRAAL